MVKKRLLSTSSEYQWNPVVNLIQRVLDFIFSGVPQHHSAHVRCYVDDEREIPLSIDGDLLNVLLTYILRHHISLCQDDTGVN